MLRWDLLDRGSAATFLVPPRKSLARKNAWALFHDIWTQGVRLQDFWVIFGPKKLENDFYFCFGCGNAIGHPSSFSNVWMVESAWRSDSSDRRSQDCYFIHVSRRGGYSNDHVHEWLVWQSRFWFITKAIYTLAWLRPQARNRWVVAHKKNLEGKYRSCLESAREVDTLINSSLPGFLMIREFLYLWVSIDTRIYVFLGLGWFENASVSGFPMIREVLCFEVWTIWETMCF